MVQVTSTPCRRNLLQRGSPSMAVTYSLAWVDEGGFDGIEVRGVIRTAGPKRGLQHEAVLRRVASDEAALQTLTVLSDHSIGQLEVPPSCLELPCGGRIWVDLYNDPLVVGVVYRLDRLGTLLLLLGGY